MKVTNKGLYFAFITALISGLAVFFNKFAVSFWQSSSVFTTAKNLVAVFFIFSLVLLLGKVGELKKLSKGQWLRLVAIGLVGGSVPFLLFFKGLSITSAVNAAFIHKTLFVWVAFLAIPFLKEKISGLQFLALGFLFSSIYLFSSPSIFVFGYGEFLVLVATLLWAVENIIAKKILKDVSSLAVAWGRMFFGSFFLLIYLLFTGSIGQLWVLSLDSLGWLILSGALLFGYTVSWYTALKYAPAMVVASVLVLAVPITVLFNSIFITHQFNSSFVLPMGLLLLAVLLMSKIYEPWFKSFRQIRSAS